MTDWRKLDAALASALGTAGDRPLSVFIHYDPEAADQLSALGFGGGGGVGGIVTETLAPEQIAALSEQPFVRQIRLSTPLRLLDDQ